MEFNNIKQISRIISNAPGGWMKSLSRGEKLLIEVLGFFKEVDLGWDIYKVVSEQIDPCLIRGHGMMLDYHRWNE